MVHESNNQVESQGEGERGPGMRKNICKGLMLRNGPEQGLGKSEHPEARENGRGWRMQNKVGPGTSGSWRRC